MANSDKVKVAVLVLVLLGAIVIVDAGQNYANNNRITAMAVGDTTDGGLTPYYEVKFFDSYAQLVNGWNLISVTKPMIGKNLYSMTHITTPSVKEGSVVSGFITCNITKAWLYNAKKPEYWMFVQDSDRTVPEAAVHLDRFTSGVAGWGMWVEVKEMEDKGGCELGCGLTSCNFG